MTEQEFDHACLALPGTGMDVQWGGDRVYKVGGRMFAVLGKDGGCSFKCTDTAYELLTSEGLGRPAPYMARAKWVYFDSPSALPDAEMADRLKTAHELVAAKLTRAARRELGLD